MDGYVVHCCVVCWNASIMPLCNCIVRAIRANPGKAPGIFIYPACGTSLAVGDIQDVLVDSNLLNGGSDYFTSIRYILEISSNIDI